LCALRFLDNNGSLSQVKGLGFEVLYPTPDENATLKGPIKYE
jgi:hypothetical protein